MGHLDAIVVGAGLAGITAARLLQDQGRTVVVLEARDRVGGRMHTARDGRITDLGASWIHGIAGSPVAAAAEALGMPAMEFTVGGYQPDSRPIAYYAADGRRLSDAAAARFAADVHELDAALADVIADSAPDASYRDVTEQALSTRPWDDDRMQRVREYLEHRAEEQYGVRIEDLAAHGLDDDAIEGDEVVFPRGYDELPTRLAEGLDIRFGHVVSRVEWTEGARTEGARVSAAGKRFTADVVVLTVPVGVLKSGELELVPALPESNAGALARLEMNAFEKVVLRFPRSFWDEGVYAIRQQGAQGRWWHSWYDLTPLHGEPTLLTFAAGPAARTIRDWDDERVADDVMRQLRRLFGAGIPAPVGVHRTAWQDDPFARGSYAYMTVGATTADHDDLADPIGGVLHIAGEATWTDDPATVAAAMLSGHRAAERILGREVPIERLWAEM